MEALADGATLVAGDLTDLAFLERLIGSEGLIASREDEPLRRLAGAEVPLA